MADPSMTRRGWLAWAEVDTRVLGMAVALAAVAVGFDWLSDGVFLTPRNLYNLAVQSSVVGILATGMVWVIVTRHIDLSVGSVLGFTGMVIAYLQVDRFPADAAWNPPLTVGLGLVLGAAIGAWQGYWVAYRGLPAFVVTLAGLLMFRGAAFLVTDGRTVAPLDPGYQLLGGGLHGSIGAAWSWALAGGVIAVTALLGWRGRRRRAQHGIPMRPWPAELGLFLLLAGAVVGFVMVMNSALQPRTAVPRGIPIPVLILLAVTIVMARLTRVTRFGRYVYAIGGSPEAAALAGIHVRRVTLGVFAVMGLLAALGGVVTTARLGAGTNSMGTLAELSVIAAAVIGGTSLAGGHGTIGGAVLGAVLMQSLDNGMVLLGVSSPMRQVWIGAVLIAAVWVDTAARRRQGAT